jgi:flagellar biogenesis protein FliO
LGGGLLAAPALGSIPFRSDPAENGELTWRVGGALALAVALVVAAAYGVRRYAPWLARAAGNARARGLVQVVDTLRVAPRLNLFVVEFGNERVLIAHSEGAVTIVGRAPAAPPT